MDAFAYTADTACYIRGISGVFVLQNYFPAAYHIAGGPGICDHTVFNLYFDT
jgi:hypothetical protein